MSSAYCSNTFHRSLRPTSSLAILTYASTVLAIRRRYVPPSCWMRLVLYSAGVTQDRGGTLDVVITRVEDRPSTVDIITAPGRASDHRLVVWPFHAAKVETPVYRTQRRRFLRKFDVDQFRADLQSSCLCDGLINSSLGDDDSLGDDASVMASRLDEVVTALLDVHAPMTEITCRVRRSSDGWYDSECR